MITTIWSCSRIYYFLFYVIHKFFDPQYKFSGLFHFILYLINRGKKIACYGATSKTTTIFNYCDIDQKQISYITDTSLTKQGKFSPGKHIPIHDYDYFLDNLPDFCFLGAWNHTAEIFNKERNNFSIKGKWITHIPNVCVV